MTMSKELQRTRVQLILGYPFFASLLFNMETIETKDVHTACTNGVNLKVNPDFLLALDESARMGLIAHELLHPAFGHHLRRNGRNPKLWNVACDYAINPILVEHGFKLPKGGLLDSRFAGMSADSIYNIIANESGESEHKWQAGDGFGGGMGDVEDFPDIDDEGKVKMEEATQTERLISAANSAKLMGKGIGSLNRIIGELLEPKVAYDVVLRRIMSEKAYNDYTWRKPSRKYMHSGFYLPAIESESYGEVVVAVDTSGSVTQSELDTYGSDLTAIHEITKNTVHAVYCDTAVRGSDRFDAGDSIDLKLRGGGGTDFRPPFRWVEEQNLSPKVLIYFTDGECSRFPATPPDYDVIWIITSSYKFNPPFGEVITI